jgi:hypothetical protein
MYNETDKNLKLIIEYINPVDNNNNNNLHHPIIEISIPSH